MTIHTKLEKFEDFQPEMVRLWKAELEEKLKILEIFSEASSKKVEL